MRLLFVLWLTLLCVSMQVESSDKRIEHLKNLKHNHDSKTAKTTTIPTTTKKQINTPVFDPLVVKLYILLTINRAMNAISLIKKTTTEFS